MDRRCTWPTSNRWSSPRASCESSTTIQSSLERPADSLNRTSSECARRHDLDVVLLPLLAVCMHDTMSFAASGASKTQVKCRTHDSPMSAVANVWQRFSIIHSPHSNEYPTVDVIVKS
jgi:hypothetical protein